MSLKELFSRFNLLNNSRTIYLNADGSILTWTERLRKETQYSEKEVIGKYYSFLYSEKDADNEFYNKLLTLAGVKGSATHIVRTKSRKAPCKIKIEAVKSDEGVVLGFTMTER